MSASKLGRRAAVVAASGGLMVGLGLPAAAGDNQAQVSADEGSGESPNFVANDSVTVAQGKKDSVSVVGTEGLSASGAPKETKAPARDSGSEGSSSGGNSDGGSDGKKGDSDKGSGNLPDVPDGSIVDMAKGYAGVPYKWGGTTPRGWDCSGFVGFVYKKAGKDIPRTSAAQRSGGTKISKAEAKPGDLVYAATPRSHIGIYLGGDKMIDAGNERVDTSIRSFKWMGKVTFVRY